MSGTVVETSAGATLRPAWRRWRYWVGFVVVVVIAAVAVGALSTEPGRTLDPGSARKNGSLGLARLIGTAGASITRTTSLETAAHATGTVVVTSPDAYSDVQLDRLLSSGARLVAVRPGVEPLATLAPALDAEQGGVLDTPSCDEPGAVAAGRLDVPDDAVDYSGGTSSCYGGLVVRTGKLVVLGSADLLDNDHLDDDGVAALDVNILTDNRTASTITWLLPGADADGSGPASIWDLFPDGVYRAFLWLIAVGVLVVMWRARRLGGVVTEPLPVVVRSAEVVEGHGRLYARAQARDRAADALRIAATRRLAARLSLPRGTSADGVAVAVAPLVRHAPAELLSLLAGPVPGDDAALLRLASDLDHLEAAVGGAVTEGN